MKQTVTAVMLTLALTLGGCVEPDSLDSTESELSLIETLDYSILAQYEAARVAQRTTSIRYPVCIYSNYTTAITSAKRESYRALMQRVVNRWNDAIEGQAGWTITDIRLYLVGTATTCPDLDAGLKVYKVFGDMTRDRGSATYWTFLNTAGKGEFDSEIYVRELHEYGHQIGMGDTYTEAGYQLPFDQPPGVMNNYNLSGVTDLTDDDIASVRHVWARVSGRTTAQCPDGYVAGTATLNNNNHKFCVLPRYDLTSMWLGIGKCIGSSSNQLQMQSCGPVSGQEWRMVPTDTFGYVRIKNRALGYDLCLDVVNDGVNDKLRMTTCANASGQLWRLAPTASAGFYQLKTMWLGTGKCLGIINDGVNDKVRMETCSNVSGQLWLRRRR